MSNEELLVWADKDFKDGGRIKQMAARIREQRDLLGECETLIIAMRQEIQNLGGSLEGVITADATLAKLCAAQEKAGETE